ncbi:DNA-binding protein, partial [bacterium]|nr:DNA-binding protein [bacterium]
EGELFWHLHLTAGFMQAGETNMVAGHLLSATVYALEFVIRELDDVDLVRVPDAATGLMLWE